MNYSKRHLRRYWIMSAVPFLIYFIISFLPFIWDKPFWALILLILLRFPLQQIIFRISYKNFFDILYSEYDSQKFYNTIYHRPFIPPFMFRLHAEWYAGNYENLILLSKDTFETAQNIQIKCFSLLFLSRLYFELHDIEKLKKVINEFEELKRANPNGERLFSNFKIFDFYKCFIDEDYESCIKYLDDRMEALDMSKKEDQCKGLYHRVNRAVCFYWQGNIQKAKEEFEYFKKTFPNLENVNKLSLRYLAAIENNDASPLFVTISDDLETSDFKNQLLSISKKEKKIRNFFYILALLCLVFLVILSIIELIYN